MFLDINKIGAEAVVFDRYLHLPNLQGLGHEAIAVLEARMRGDACKGSRGVNLSARLDATVELSCSRCLELFRTEIASDVFLILVPDAVELPAGKEEVDPEDVALFYTKEGKASLGEIATEQIYLNLPLKPICDPDCKGLCPGCGANRNRTACDCKSETTDPRLAPLLRFRSQR